MNLPTSSDVCEECHGYSGGNDLCYSCRNGQETEEIWEDEEED